MALQRVVKPKNQRVKRILANRESKIIENDKSAMFIKGGKTSEVVNQALKDLYALKKPNAVLFQKKNATRPFEDQTSVEFFSEKSDSSLFMFGSHSKKRPNNLIIGRLFDGHVLDMIELGIDKSKNMSSFTGSKSSLGTKPCLVFAGEAFQQDVEHQRVKNLLIDFFRGPVVTNVRLSGLEHVLQFTATDGKIYLRSYKILLKKSGCRTPRIELEEMGPSFDFVLRRTHIASDDLYRRSLRVPKAAKKRVVKNKKMDAFGTQHGQIHMQKQNLDSLQVRKMKGLKRKRATDNDDATPQTDNKKLITESSE